MPHDVQTLTLQTVSTAAQASPESTQRPVVSQQSLPEQAPSAPPLHVSSAQQRPGATPQAVQDPPVSHTVFAAAHASPDSTHSPVVSQHPPSQAAPVVQQDEPGAPHAHESFAHTKVSPQVAPGATHVGPPEAVPVTPDLQEQIDPIANWVAEQQERAQKAADGGEPHVEPLKLNGHPAWRARSARRAVRSRLA